MDLTYLHLLSFTSLTYILGWFQEEKYLPANAIHTLFCRLTDCMVKGNQVDSVVFLFYVEDTVGK